MTPSFFDVDRGILSEAFREFKQKIGVHGLRRGLSARPRDHDWSVICPSCPPSISFLFSRDVSEIAYHWVSGSLAHWICNFEWNHRASDRLPDFPGKPLHSQSRFEIGAES